MSALPDAIGQYTILRELGRGGMGVVYLARDTRLDRDVAIKVLPESMARDPERVARFEREAKLLASLNHTNIAHIYGFESSGEAQFLVLEFVEGETLSARLKRGPLPMDEALDACRQVTEALEAAHERGIVHRDLKPGNVMLTADGTVKVLDFGLARAMASDETESGGFADSPTMTAHSPTITDNFTRPGMILGTAAYMSPEQARGRPVDKRTDIWSFGVILYECLTGDTLFAGETVTDSIGAILHKEVDFDRLPRQTPEHVKGVIVRCLSRDKLERYRDIGDVRLDLRSPRTVGPSNDAIARRMARMAVPAFLLVGIMGAAIGWFARQSGPVAPDAPPQVTRFEIEPGPLSGSDRDLNFYVSPDGAAVAYLSDSGLYVRSLAQPAPRKIDLAWDADQLTRGPLKGWTSDSRSLIVARWNGPDRELWRVPIDEGEARMIGRLEKDVGLTITAVGQRDDELVVSTLLNGTYTFPMKGGAARLLVPPKGFSTGMCVLPGGQLLIARSDGDFDIVDGGDRTLLFKMQDDRVEYAMCSSTGHVVFLVGPGSADATGVWAVPFSIDRLEVTGSAFRMLPTGHVSVSENGVMAYQEEQEQPLGQLVVVDRSGEIESTIGEPMIGLIHPRVAPDGRRIAFAAVKEGFTRDIFILDRDRGDLLHLVDAAGNDYWPAWRGDGDTICYVTWSGALTWLMERRSDGSGEAAHLTTGFWTHRSASGRYLFFTTRFEEDDTAGVSPDRGSRRSGLAFYEENVDEIQRADAIEVPGTLSPDDRYIATCERQPPGVLLQPFKNDGRRTLVTASTARDVYWSADGTELFILTRDELVSVGVDLSGDRPVIGAQQVLFTAESTRLNFAADFDLLEDGRFLMVKDLSDPEASAPRPIVVTQNWAAEYEDR